MPKTACSATPDSFRSLQFDAWPTPNELRLASGAPGGAYWQQKVDYDIAVSLDAASRSLTGSETIRYHNHSPHRLGYVWFSLDQNKLRPDSVAERSRAIDDKPLSAGAAARSRYFASYPGDMRIEALTDLTGRALPHVVYDTFMRVDLPRAIRPGETRVFKVRWSYRLADGRVTDNGRTGYDCLNPHDPRSCIYGVAQWFPRLAAYSDYKGWHLNPFIGIGSFALEMGDYRVAITAPRGQIVAATGALANPRQVLTAEQNARLQSARHSDRAISIVTRAEAAKARSETLTGAATWRFRADNVRDFAWSSSAAYEWQAAAAPPGNGRAPSALAMAFFPEEAEATWGRIAVPAIRHAIHTGQRFLYDYPYPVIQAAYAPAPGFEYPMLVFVGGGRSTVDAARAVHVTAGDLDSLATALFHEVGHSWFPITVNSDEREWMWMDEGLNTFLEYQAELAWRDGFITRVSRGDPAEIGAAMAALPQRTPMDRPDSLVLPRTEGYDKPAVALEVLRTVVLGPERFDRAFRTYAERWKFKRPTAFDFFRTMQDASGKDLDWFWRGWFYSTDHVDLALEGVERVPLAAAVTGPAQTLAARRHRALSGPTQVERDPDLQAAYAAAAAALPLPPQPAAPAAAGEFFYRLRIRNLGGVISPIPLRIDFVDGTSKDIQLDAEIWRQNPKLATWLYRCGVAIRRVTIDPERATGDSDVANNAMEGPF